MTEPRIMVVEDDPVISMVLRERLKKLKYQVTAVVSSGEEALRQAEQAAPDLVLMDIRLEGDMDGIETASRLRALFSLPVIYVTAYTDDSLLERAKHTEPLGYLVKPYGERELRSTIEMALYRGRMERLLRESEDRFRTLIEAAPFGISVMATDGTFEYLNPKFSEIFGYTVHDVPDKSTWFAKAYPNEDYRKRVSADWALATIGGPRAGEAEPKIFTVQCKDGAQKIIGFRIVVLDDGRQILTYQDVTSEENAKEEIIRAKNEWELTFDAVSDLIMILDNEQRIVRMNRAMANALQMSPESIIGSKCYEVVHGKQAPPPNCPHAMMIAEPREHWAEVFERKLGGIFDVRVAPIRASDGKTIGAVHAARDITQRKQAEEELRHANELLEQLLATAATAILTVDRERRITGVNDEFCRITGFRRDEILGKHCDSLTIDSCGSICALDVSETTHGIFKVQCSLKARDGRTLTVIKNAAAMRDGRGRIIGGMESFIDVTELFEARMIAEAANKAKTDFLTNMSHELRTPLNAIIGFSELLLEEAAGPLNEDQSSYVSDVLDGGRHLLDLINSILDLAKVEAGKMELQLSRVSIADLLENGLVMIKERAIRHRLKLDLLIEDEIRGLEIQADEVKLKQIVFNLLSNAAKFTHDGGAIQVQAEKIGETIQVSVSDTGVGLEREDRERIFTMFEQVDSSYSRRQQGTGLGLALTRRLVELHGGRIWVESEGRGKGSSFRFVIPIIRPADLIDEQIPERPPDQYLPHLSPASGGVASHDPRPTVLVVEDLDDNIQVITALLRHSGLEAIVARTAEEGIELARTQKPDLVLMDVSLPGMDGLEATRILKGSPQTTHIPVIAVTAHAMDGDEQRCREAGCDGYIAKPIRMQTLRRIITDAVNVHKSR